MAFFAQRLYQAGGQGLYALGVGVGSRCDEQWQALGFGAAVCSGDGRTQHALGLHILCQCIKRCVGQGVLAQRLRFYRIAQAGCTQVLQLGQGLALFDGFQVAVQGLFVQPMGCAAQLLGCSFEPVTHQLIHLDANGCCRHNRRTP